MRRIELSANMRQPRVKKVRFYSGQQVSNEHRQQAEHAELMSQSMPVVARLNLPTRLQLAVYFTFISHQTDENDFVYLFTI